MPRQGAARQAMSRPAGLPCRQPARWQGKDECATWRRQGHQESHETTRGSPAEASSGLPGL